MKKIIILIILILLILVPNNNKDDLIRIRVLANSNSAHDQELKEKVSSDIKKEMYTLLKEETNVDSARKIIKNNIPLVEKVVSDNLSKEDYGYKVNYGLNYFPKKTYNDITYKEGKYESLLVTLGSGVGDNWWCILFPPLCLIEVEESEEVEYNFFLKDLIDSILH